MRFPLTCLAAIRILACSLSLADDAKPAKPFGLEQRSPWTTSQVRGRPEPPSSFKPERLDSQRRFNMTPGAVISWVACLTIFGGGGTMLRRATS